MRTRKVYWYRYRLGLMLPWIVEARKLGCQTISEITEVCREQAIQAGERPPGRSTIHRAMTELRLYGRDPGPDSRSAAQANRKARSAVVSP